MTSSMVRVILGQATETAAISMVQVRDEGPNLHWPWASGFKMGIVIRLHRWPGERCHTPNKFGTVNMEDNVNIKRS